jgi:hypothetical protein
MAAAATILGCARVPAPAPTPAPATAGGETEQNVLRAELANGLRVVIVRNPLAPVVANEIRITIRITIRNRNSFNLEPALRTG